MSGVELFRCRRKTVASPSSQQVPLAVKDAHSAARLRLVWRVPGEDAGVKSQLKDEDVASGINMDLRRSCEVVPDGSEVAVRREDLHAAVFPIGDVQLLAV